MIAALFIGMIVSLGITELTGYSPGGIIVAGYLAQFIMQPVWLGGTLAAALLTYGIVSLFASRLLLFGRRQFAVYILVGVLISQFAMRVTLGHTIGDIGFLVVGYLIPGLVARDFDRQGIVSTLSVMTLAVVLTHMILLAGEGLVW